MKKLIIVGFLVLAGCNASQVQTAATIYKIRSAYDAAVLAPAARYASLPRCTVAPPPCSQPKVVATLRALDAKASKAINVASNFAMDNPTVDATSLISLAQAAVSAALSYAQANGVK